jgi:hypothetical protein
MDDKLVEYSGNSAPFHVGMGLMLFNRGLSFIINRVFPDDSDSRNLEINDENSLKKKIFEIIQRRYNARIHHHDHQLKLPDISANHFAKLKIIKYKFLKDFDNEEPSGQYSLFPNAFVCKKCGHYVMNKDLRSFNPKQCSLCGEGEYEQVSLLRFCSTCGQIDKFYYQCQEHGTESIKLIRADKDNLLTWKFVCGKCKDKELDIFRFQCEHKINPKGSSISAIGKTKFQPITIRESGIFSPQVVTHIDLPKTASLRDIEIDKELVMFGFHFDSFKDIPQIKDLRNVYSILNSYESDKRDGYEINEQKEKDVEKIRKIINDLKEIKKDIHEDVLKEFNELNTLKETIGYTNFEEYVRLHHTSDEEIIIQDMINNYNLIVNDFGIKNINYLSKIKLINSLIGLIKGVNKFWDENEKPHFELFWKNLAQELTMPYVKQVDRENEPFYVYSYPFETEALLLELKPENICKWLYENKIIPNEVKTEDAKSFLLKLKPDENKVVYDLVYSLLHTMSHMVLKNIHIYTGVGIESCGEKIFVNGGAILIYANNNLNIGALQYLFENKMFCEEGIFQNMKLKINDCSFDPLCIDQKGSCFSCLYIPEFVCCNFNLKLDRDLYLGKGKRKITKSYWDIK